MCLLFIGWKAGAYVNGIFTIAYSVIVSLLRLRRTSSKQEMRILSSHALSYIIWIVVSHFCFTYATNHQFVISWTMAAHSLSNITYQSHKPSIHNLWFTVFIIAFRQLVVHRVYLQTNSCAENYLFTRCIYRQTCVPSQH